VQLSSGYINPRISLSHQSPLSFGASSHCLRCYSTVFNCPLGRFCRFVLCCGTQKYRPIFSGQLHNEKRFPPHTKPKCRNHVRAHEEIIRNEIRYGDQAPRLGRGFTAAKTQERATIVNQILLRAAKKADKTGNLALAQAYYQLSDKSEGCQATSRCGSLACALCARAYQKAKTVAQQTAITEGTKTRPGRHLVFVTVVPKAMMYSPGEFHRIEVKKANRWLKDALKPVGSRMILGSADLGWETRRSGKYIQIHWHLAMWTSNPGNLEKKLKLRFRKTKKYERPVEVKIPDDLGFLPYMNKAIKLPHLLRTNRTHLPELLLVLDSIEPMDLMVQTKLRLSAQSGRLAFRRIGRKEG
jgi:hypothetical protein